MTSLPGSFFSEDILLLACSNCSSVAAAHGHNGVITTADHDGSDPTGHFEGAELCKCSEDCRRSNGTTLHPNSPSLLSCTTNESTLTPNQEELDSPIIGEAEVWNVRLGILENLTKKKKDSVLHVHLKGRLPALTSSHGKKKPNACLSTSQQRKTHTAIKVVCNV